MVKEFITSAIKKVTLELIYQVVNERTEELKSEIGEIKNEIKDLKKRQEEDFRYLVQKIDTSTGQINQRIDTIIQMLMEFKK
jgi:hypothetical protein